MRQSDPSERPGDQDLFVRWQESFNGKIQADMLEKSGRLALEEHENCVQIGLEITKLLTSEYCEYIFKSFPAPDCSKSNISKPEVVLIENFDAEVLPRILCYF